MVLSLVYGLGGIKIFLHVISLFLNIGHALQYCPFPMTLSAATLEELFGIHVPSCEWLSTPLCG